MTNGFPVQTIDISTPAQAKGLGSLVAQMVPTHIYFSSLRENQLLCERTGFGGWRVLDLQGGAQPPAETIAKWIRSGGLLRNAIAACPQAALLVWLLHVENVLQVPEKTDLQEARQVYLQYQCVKDWLLNQALPQEPWQELLAAWPIEEVESRVFHAYKRVLTSAYNELSDSASASTAPAEAAAGQEEAGAFYAVCPQARGAAHANALVAPSAGSGSSRVEGSGPSAYIIEGPVPVAMALLGNALSLYWQARGLAALAGVPFRVTGGQGHAHFIRHLPRTAPVHAGLANVSALRDSCGACWRVQHWRWPHLCLGAWAKIQESIGTGTRSALRLSGAEAAARALLRPCDVAVHLRCFPFFSSEYPLAAFSLLSSIPPHWAGEPGLRFLLVAGTLGPVCAAVVDALEAYLHGRFPQAAVARRFNTTAKPGVMAEDLASAEAAELDFAILVHAPLLVRTPSTFSLWAALARGGSGAGATPGLVLSVPNPPRPLSNWDWETADFGANWIWSRTRLLTADVVERHGFVFEQPERWIRWLESQ